MILSILDIVWYATLPSRGLVLRGLSINLLTMLASVNDTTWAATLYDSRLLLLLVSLGRGV